MTLYTNNEKRRRQKQEKLVAYSEKERIRLRGRTSGQLLPRSSAPPVGCSWGSWPKERTKVVLHAVNIASVYIKATGQHTKAVSQTSTDVAQTSTNGPGTGEWCCICAIRCCACTHQMTALFSVKSRHDRHLKIMTLIDANLLEEQSSQISRWSDLKRRSLELF